MAKKVLIVDDEEQLAQMYAMRLQSNGYETIVETNPLEALSLAQEIQPDVILLDVLMPQMNGRIVCKKLKENPQTQDIPIIFLTAKDSIDDIKAELEVGAEGHITKPVNIQDLLDRLESTLYK